MPKPVIITCAPTVEAAEAGAAIIHPHARNPRTGQPDPSPELFQRFMPRNLPELTWSGRDFPAVPTRSSGPRRRCPPG
ncbi:3-keto-5-aminohexanoate cleavage protein [Streptomyces sp. NPDC050534]|uniref:3-keto-5-aminohexanoate cleavage protein n=1 Tax=Streptomyces sp. NPDC050534 TaxID=3365625 RepID=UPI00378E2BFA